MGCDHCDRLKRERGDEDEKKEKQDEEEGAAEGDGVLARHAPLISNTSTHTPHTLSGQLEPL